MKQKGASLFCGESRITWGPQWVKTGSRHLISLQCIELRLTVFFWRIWIILLTPLGQGKTERVTFSKLIYILINTFFHLSICTWETKSGHEWSLAGRAWSVTVLFSDSAATDYHLPSLRYGPSKSKVSKNGVKVPYFYADFRVGSWFGPLHGQNWSRCKKKFFPLKALFVLLMVDTKSFSLLPFFSYKGSK